MRTNSDKDIDRQMFVGKPDFPCRGRLRRHFARRRDELEQVDLRKDEFSPYWGMNFRNRLSSIHNVLAILRQSPGDPQLDRRHGLLGRQVDYLTWLVSVTCLTCRYHAGKGGAAQATHRADVVHDAMELVDLP